MFRSPAPCLSVRRASGARSARRATRVGSSRASGFRESVQIVRRPSDNVIFGETREIAGDTWSVDEERTDGAPERMAGVIARADGRSSRRSISGKFGESANRPGDYIHRHIARASQCLRVASACSRRNPSRSVCAEGAPVKRMC